MAYESITSVSWLLAQIKSLRTFPDTIILFRGQSNNLPLIPSVCRKHPDIDSTEKEEKMLDDLKRRSTLLISEQILNKWDLLTYAQHYGMATRLLDWSTNPLVALWFAIKNVYAFDKESYLYLFFIEDEDFLNDVDKENGPFRTGRTKVLQPILNNRRVIAQQGWFTSHIYSKKNEKFIAMENNKDLKHRLMTFKVEAKHKKDMLDELNILGINYQSMYTDLVGLCDQINWENKVY